MISGDEPRPAETGWVLDCSVDGGKSIQRVPIQGFPFRIGRLEAMDLAIPVQSVSKLHAEIAERDAGLHVRDMDSTNGTFVNRRRISSSVPYAVCPPIVALPEARIVAYEVLGRGLHPELPRGPAELFPMAEAIECEGEPSRLFRRRGREQA